MNIAGYRVLEVGEIIKKGDITNHKSNDSEIGAIEASALGLIVCLDDYNYYYRPADRETLDVLGKK